MALARYRERYHLTKQETKTLGVRLSSAERELVEKRAGQLGLKPGTYAKKVILEAELGDAGRDREPDGATGEPGVINGGGVPGV